MMETKDKIKRHFKKYKDVYLVVATAGITCLIMREAYAHHSMSAGRSDGINIRPLLKSLVNTGTITQETLLANKRDGRGHPGYPVWWKEKDIVFPSQHVTSIETGIPENVLSGHLNGKFPNADGYHFERLTWFEKPQEIHSL
jgi:hypothetical protein